MLKKRCHIQKFRRGLLSASPELTALATSVAKKRFDLFFTKVKANAYSA